MHGAGPGEETSPVRRPGRRSLLVIAVLLLLGGGTALAVGLLGQVADPPLPSAAQRPTSTTSSPSTTATPLSTTPAPSSTTPAPTTGTTPAPTTRTTPAPSTTTVAGPPGTPVSISIPSIDVRSELLQLGTNPDGSLQVPQPGPDYDKAAWFDGSPRPGDIGPAVIEGHVDSAKNGPSVFYSLGAVSVGDRIEVSRADGSTVTFEVYEARVVPKKDFPTLEVYGNTEGPELRLITCGGPFDRAVGHYEDNVVVFARLVA